MSVTIIGFLILKLLGLAFAVLLAVRVAAAFRGLGPHGARAILDRRFAQGEIVAGEYRLRRAVLED
jgi:uncharacterized membrane protein